MKRVTAHARRPDWRRRSSQIGHSPNWRTRNGLNGRLLRTRLTGKCDADPARSECEPDPLSRRNPIDQTPFWLRRLPTDPPPATVTPAEIET